MSGYFVYFQKPHAIKMYIFIFALFSYISQYENTNRCQFSRTLGLSKKKKTRNGKTRTLKTKLKLNKNLFCNKRFLCSLLFIDKIVTIPIPMMYWCCCHALRQGCKRHGPRAGSGPPDGLIWPIYEEKKRTSFQFMPVASYGFSKK